MALRTIKGRQNDTMAWLYTICWCLSCLSSIVALVYSRAHKHKWNPFYVLILVVIGLMRHIAIFVGFGLSFLLTLYILEIDEGENFMPGFVTTCVPMIYFLFSIQRSRSRLQKLEKEA